jgi:outer membrane protein assembly factor BamB
MIMKTYILSRGSFRSSIILFSGMLLIMLESCMMKPVYNSVERANESQLDVNKWKPFIIRQTPITAQEVDIMEFIGEDNVLVGTIKLKGMGNIWAAKEDELMLYDLNKGIIKWKIPRKSLCDPIQQVLATNSGILIKGISDNYRSLVLLLNEETGSVKWQYEGESPGTRMSFMHPCNKIIAAYHEKPDLIVKGFDLSNGQELWKVDIGEFFQREELAFEIRQIENKVTIIGESIARIDPDKGILLWRTSFPEFNENSLYVTNNENNLIISCESGIRVMDINDGKIKWEIISSGNKIITTYMNEEKLFVLEQQNSSSGVNYIINRLDLQSGKNIWIHSLKNPVRSSLKQEGNMLYYATGNKLYGLDITNGQIACEAAIPEALQSDKGLYDHLIINKDRILLARETGILAYSTENNELLYAHYIDGSRTFANSFLTHKISSRMSGPAGSDFRMAAITDAASNLAVQTSTVNMQMSQMQLDYITYQTDQVLSSSTSTSYERSAAITERYVAAQTNYAVARASAHAQLLVSIANFGMALQGVAASYRQAWVSASRRLNQIQAEHTYLTHSSSIQKGYYIRPFYNKGMGLTIVRLEDGKRADIYISQDNEPLRINGANLPIFLISGDGRYLITKGLGVVNEDIPTYTEMAWPADITFFPDKWKIPYPSIITYNLNDDMFAGKTSTVSELRRSSEEMSGRDREFLQAVFYPDLDKAKELLKEGANINVIDEYGYNALFYGALLDSKNTVKFLIKNGCDASLRDAHGWLAWHYSFLTHVMPKSTSMLAKASKKVMKR